MYLEHFGLRELPYTLSPNTEFFIDLDSHREALALVIRALQAGNGHIQLCGEVGTGKTLLCRRLQQACNAEFLFACIPNPFLSPEGLSLALVRELGGDPRPEADYRQLQDILHEKLAELLSAGRKIVILLDDAQAMPESTLHALLDLPYGKYRHALQIVFSGQPELADLLNRDSLQLLKSGISCRHTLPSLGREETARYIRYRLLIAGFPGSSLFTPPAVEQIHKSGRGNPRIFNILCHKALLAAFSRRDTRVNYLHVLRAIEETDDALPSHSDAANDALFGNWRNMLMACMGASAMTLTLLWALILR